MAHSFTARYTGLARDIITDIHISKPTTDSKEVDGDKRVHKTSALWDTGATGSVITTAIAAQLGLKPTSMTRVFHAGGTTYENVYFVDIYLPNNVCVRGVRVTECPDTVGNFGVIIGMDIISFGDFSFTNVDRKSVFSFRTPSTETIDYAKYKRGIAEAPYVAAKAPGRNDKCPCGSGKKYKDCCLRK